MDEPRQPADGQEQRPRRRSGASGPSLSNRDRIRLMMLLVLAVVAIGAVFTLVNRSPTAGGAGAPLDDLVSTALPEPMGFPDLDRLPPMPEPSALADTATQVEWLERNPEEAHLHLNDPMHPVAQAWARHRTAQDRAAPPLPQGFSPADLARGAGRAGLAIRLSGLLVDVRQASGDTDWNWCLIKLDDLPVFALVLVEAGAEPQGGLTPGLHISAIGRLMGRIALPDNDGGTVRVPMAMARVVREHSEGQVVDELRLGQQALLRPDGTLTDDNLVFADIDDDRPVLELRPYYWLIGQAYRDRANMPEDLPDGNLASYQMHLRPDDFRGQIYRVRTYVLAAEEDALVARERPFGAERVIRIRGWRRVHGVQFERRDLEGRISTEMESPLMAYEFAVIADRNEALPKPGDEVEIVGRFLKIHAYPVERNPLRDAVNEVRRQSQFAYFKMFVAGGMTNLGQPVPPDFGPIGIAFFVIASSLLLFMVWMISRHHRHDDDWKRSVRALREGRRRAERSAKATPEQPSATDQADS